VNNNPFKFGTIVDEPFFFDRVEEKKRIVDVLQGGNNLVLIAPRRYGKSSLVLQAAKELQKQGHRCIYFDFMSVYSRESFADTYTRAILKMETNWQKILKQISGVLKGIRPVVSLNPQGQAEFSLNYDDSTISDYSLESVLDLPETIATDKNPLVVIMDEFQEISKLNGESFENLLRSRIQHHKNVRYLFLGSRTHMLNDMFNNKNRPFYHSAMTMSIGALPKPETIQFIRERFSVGHLDIADTTIELIIQKAGAIPYYIQFLAAEIWQYARNQDIPVTDKLVDICAENILTLKNDYYLELFQRHTSHQKKVLSALAKDGQNIFSADYNQKHRLSAASSTQKAVSLFIQSGIIEKYDNQYEFSDPFFKCFLLRLEALRLEA
jgi:uncharacterized protein